jgi:hypothetical protein
MIKFKVIDPNGVPGFGFGLSEENINLLKQGKPIIIELSEMGGIGRIMIMYGKTETDLVAALQPFMDNATQIHQVKKKDMN